MEHSLIRMNGIIVGDEYDSRTLGVCSLCDERCMLAIPSLLRWCSLVSNEIHFLLRTRSYVRSVDMYVSFRDIFSVPTYVRAPLLFPCQNKDLNLSRRVVLHTYR